MQCFPPWKRFKGAKQHIKCHHYSLLCGVWTACGAKSMLMHDIYVLIVFRKVDDEDDLKVLRA